MVMQESLWKFMENAVFEGHSNPKNTTFDHSYPIFSLGILGKRQNIALDY